MPPVQQAPVAAPMPGMPLVQQAPVAAPMPGMPLVQQAPVAAPMPGMPPVQQAPVAAPMPGMPPVQQAPVAAPMPGMPPVPPVKEEDKTPANFKLGEKFDGNFTIPPLKHNLSFDEQHFINLLAGSISLSKAEKRRILDSIPKLKQSQVDELINIFEDERKKFAELPEKHSKELERLAKKHYEDWKSIEDDYKAANQEEEEASKADDIRKQLGI